MKSVVAYTDTVIILVKCSDNKLHLESIELKKYIEVEIPHDTILIYSPNNNAVINTGSECAPITINNLSLYHYKDKDTLGMISNQVLEDIKECSGIYTNDPHFKTAKELVKGGVELCNLSGDTYTLIDKENLPPNNIKVSEVDSSKLDPDLVNHLVLGVLTPKFSIGTLMLEDSIRSVVYKVKGESYTASGVRLYNDTILDDDVTVIVCTSAGSSKIKSCPVPVVVMEYLIDHNAIYNRIKQLKESGKLEESISNGDTGYMLFESMDYKLDNIVNEDSTKRHEFNVDDIATSTTEDNLRECGLLMGNTTDDPKRMSLSMPHMAFDSTPVNHCLECGRSKFDSVMIDMQEIEISKDGYVKILNRLVEKGNLNTPNVYALVSLVRLMTEDLERGERWSDIYNEIFVSLSMGLETEITERCYKGLEDTTVAEFKEKHLSTVVDMIAGVQGVSGLDIFERLIELDENYF